MLFDCIRGHPCHVQGYVALLARSGMSGTENVIATEALLQEYVRMHALAETLPDRPAFTDKHAHLIKLQVCSCGWRLIALYQIYEIYSPSVSLQFHLGCRTPY